MDTHVELHDTVRFAKYFGSFELIWQPATRNSSYGRAIGGCLLGIKKELNKYGLRSLFKNYQGVHVINIVANETIINIVPLYMRAANWKDDFNALML